MSYRDFSRGMTPEEVQERKRAGIVERDEAAELRQIKEHEHRMGIVRGIQAWNQKLDRKVKRVCQGYHVKI